VAAAGAIVSPLLLISDLGRPDRFLNMLRVFKLRSPMSIGAWTLIAFTPAVLTPIAIGLLAPGSGAPGQFVVALADITAALTGLILATYTGVLIGATAIPVWAAHARVLPPHFGASSLGAAVSIIELCGHFTPAMNLLGLAAALGETVIGAGLELRRLSPGSALGKGRAGLATRLGDALAGPVPFVLRLTSASWLPGRLAAAISAIAGSALTRYGWLQAGRRSAAESRASR
jgi:formate-dependent nitrite reductase membrane component NrfD